MPLRVEIVAVIYCSKTRNSKLEIKNDVDDTRNYWSDFRVSSNVVWNLFNELATPYTWPFAIKNFFGVSRPRKDNQFCVTLVWGAGLRRLFAGLSSVPYHP